MGGHTYKWMNVGKFDIRYDNTKSLSSQKFSLGARGVVHGQKFALEAEVEIETEICFLQRLGLKLSLTIQGLKGVKSRLGGVPKERSHVN